MKLYAHMPPILQRAKITAAYGYLLKPMSRRELAATIASFFFANRAGSGQMGNGH